MPFFGLFTALQSIPSFLTSVVLFLTAQVSRNLADVVTEDMLNGVLDQVIGLLPVLLPVMITFIGFRKGIAFIQNILHAA